MLEYVVLATFKDNTKKAYYFNNYESARRYKNLVSSFMKDNLTTLEIVEMYN